MKKNADINFWLQLHNVGFHEDEKITSNKRHILWALGDAPEHACKAFWDECDITKLEYWCGVLPIQFLKLQGCKVETLPLLISNFENLISAALKLPAIWVDNNSETMPMITIKVKLNNKYTEFCVCLQNTPFLSKVAMLPLPFHNYLTVSLEFKTKIGT